MLGFDSLGDRIEVPQLGVVVVSVLDSEISSCNSKQSGALHQRNNLEWSVFVETVAGIHLVAVKIFDIPLLVEAVMSVPDKNVLVLAILVSRYIEDFAFFVDDVGALVSEELEPSGVSVPHLQVVGSSGILNVE